jgi:dipeptidyl-peptidase III
LSNLVNYKSFGFTKIVPRVLKEKFESVVKCSSNAENALVLWAKVAQIPGLAPGGVVMLFFSS